MGRLAGVSVPLLPVQHLYARTEPLQELAGTRVEIAHPVLRHQDRAMYFRQDFASYGVGSYRHEPLAVDLADLLEPGTGGPRSALRPFTPEHFENGLADSLELFPSFEGAEFPYRINGIFAFTPDGNSLIGQSAAVEGFWLAEAVWLTHGGGVGRAIAEYMVEGTAPMDLRDVDCNRFHRHVFSPAYVRKRGEQQYREVYDVIHPLQPMEDPRRLRLSPVHSRLEELGGEMFESAGWERPQWFAANADLPRPVGGCQRQGWTARFWSPLIAAEHVATRERVSLFDLTPFTKLEVKGTGALSFLQHLAANQMDRPSGSITYTALLNQRGGIECDLTVTRLEEDRFLIVTGSGTGMRDLAWIRSQLSGWEGVDITDLTSAYCCLGLWGPASREVLQSVCENDLSDSACPYLTALSIQVREVPVLALRISYVGELGWELYVPTEYGLYLWDQLWEAGRAFGISAAGAGAFDSLRLEKGYRLWGNDIHSGYNPFEAGLGFAVRMSKVDFLGKEALVRIGRDVRRKLCCMRLEDPGVVVMGKEPIVSAGDTVGYVTSANYGYTIQESIAYGYLPVELAGVGNTVDIEFFDESHQATVVAEPRYDPHNAKLKQSASG